MAYDIILLSSHSVSLVLSLSLYFCRSVFNLVLCSCCCLCVDWYCGICVDALAAVCLYLLRSLCIAVCVHLSVLIAATTTDTAYSIVCIHCSCCLCIIIFFFFFVHVYSTPFDCRFLENLNHLLLQKMGIFDVFHCAPFEL